MTTDATNDTLLPGGRRAAAGQLSVVRDWSQTVQAAQALCARQITGRSGPHPFLTASVGESTPPTEPQRIVAADASRRHKLAPRRTAVLGRFRVERNASGEASSVMTAECAAGR